MKKFKLLLAAVAAIALAAWLASHKEQEKFGLQQGDTLLPDLAGRLADIDKVQLTAAGADALSLVLVDGQWTVGERDNYPADTQVLRRELRRLAQAKTLEAKTSQAELYARLGVEDVDQAEDTTMRLIAQAADETVVDILIGKSSGRGSYVRLSGESQSWLLDTALNLPRQTTAWLDKALLEISREQIQRIEVTPLEGPAYALSKANAEQTDFTLSPAAPEGRELSMANINRLGAALASLRLQDVATSLPADLNWSKARYQTFDGLVLDIKVAKQDSQRYLQLTASVADDRTETEPAEADAAKDPATEAARINALTQGRSFLMGQYAVDAMAMRHDMLLKDLPEDT